MAKSRYRALKFKNVKNPKDTEISKVFGQHIPKYSWTYTKIFQNESLQIKDSINKIRNPEFKVENYF